MTTAISSFNSQKFRFWSFISMVLLVFVHGYNLDERYLQPWSLVDEPLTFNTYTQYFLANGVFRFRIPMLFIISGYLYALHDDKPYGLRTRKRFRTLMLPYILWSAIGLGFSYLLETFPYGKQVMTTTRLAQFDENTMYLHDYAWWQWLIRWILAPLPFQLWFIRVLFFYNLLYPAIRWCVLKGKWVFFPLAILLWLATFNLLIIDGEGLLFFSLGVWMQKKGFNIDKPGKWLQVTPWAVIFVALAGGKTYLAFEGRALLGGTLEPVMTIMHKTVIISGLITAWFGLNQLVSLAMRQNWFVELCAFAFIIYALHVPLITYAIDPFFSLVNGFAHYRLFSFIMLPLLVIMISIGVGWLLRKTLPGTYSVLTGGRGL